MQYGLVFRLIGKLSQKDKILMFKYELQLKSDNFFKRRILFMNEKNVEMSAI